MLANFSDTIFMVIFIRTIINRFLLGSVFLGLCNFSLIYFITQSKISLFALGTCRVTDRNN